jgi:hypothetical protein
MLMSTFDPSSRDSRFQLGMLLTPLPCPCDYEDRAANPETRGTRQIWQRQARPDDIEQYDILYV